MGGPWWVSVRGVGPFESENVFNKHGQKHHVWSQVFLLKTLNVLLEQEVL